MPATAELTTSRPTRSGWSVWSISEAALGEVGERFSFWPKHSFGSIGSAAEAAFDSLHRPGAEAQRFKDDASGRVWSASLAVDDVLLPIVVKQPASSRGGRAVVDRLRRSRVARARDKTLALARHGVPTELPLLTAERRGTSRELLEQLAVYARVAGPTLKEMPLKTCEASARAALFEEAGRLLRTTSRLGYVHLDAKTSNWIATPIDGGWQPVMIDCDGVRYQPWHRRAGRGLDRFLRALQRHPDFVPSDEQSVRRGFESVK